jgi:hypothetical protein
LGCKFLFFNIISILNFSEGVRCLMAQGGAFMIIWWSVLSVNIAAAHLLAMNIGTPVGTKHSFMYCLRGF